MAANVHVADLGTIFEQTVKDETGTIVDLSSATLKQLLFRKPDGTVVPKTATLSNTGTDGKMRYVTLAGDIDQAGVWTLQGYVELSASQHYHTDETSFLVEGNLA